MPSPVSFGPLDRAIPVTFFTSYAAGEKHEEAYTLRSLASRIKTVTARKKDALPWLKMARFGDLRTESNSLRHDRNLLAISGIEADYDAGVMTVDEAVERLEKAGIAAMVYTSPSHTEDSPRWRVVCPVSQEMPGDKRQHLVGRLNGLFNGILAGESFTLSQSYYFGSVNHNPSHRVELIDGTPIDDHDELDEVWQGKPHTGPVKPGQTLPGPVDKNGLLAEIMTGAGYHTATVRIAGMLARQQVPYMQGRQILVDAMEAVPVSQRDERWRSRYADIDRTVLDIYGKEASKLDAQVHPEPPPEPEGYWEGIEALADGPQEDADPGQVEVPATFPATPLRTRDLTAIPPRKWLYGRELVRGFVSVLGSPGGVGKTAFVIGVACSLITGKALLSSTPAQPEATKRVHKTGRVWIYNLEDPADEMDRRVAAAIKHYGLNFDALADEMFVDSGRDRPLVITQRIGGDLVKRPIVADLVQELIARGIMLLVVDPFVQSHTAEENRNEEMNIVMAAWGQVAHEAGCAVWLVHHFRKGGQAADAESFRGAAAIQGAARVMSTLATMSQEEANKLGVKDGDRWQYIRRDSAKANMAPRASEAEWMRLASVGLGNGTAEYPDGDFVQVAEAWSPPSPWDGMPWGITVSVLEAIEAGPMPGEFYAAGKQSKERWAGHVLIEQAKLMEGQASEILRVWIDNGVLENGTYKSAFQKGGSTGCVRVNSSKLSELRSQKPREPGA